MLALRIIAAGSYPSMQYRLLFFAACFAAIAAFGKPEAEPFTGSYYRGDHLGYNVTLVLQKDGGYEAWWNGCLGRYGSARGRWKVKDGKLVLSPSEEIDMMKGHLRVLSIRKIDGRFELLPEEDEKRMKTKEERPLFSFTKVVARKPANRPLEPTPGRGSGTAAPRRAKPSVANLSQPAGE
jgi:hypothetical protein